ncbi:MAG: hypothetical protein RLZZ507_107 [Cyanobacteriota bacterium]|jgi:molecular chaperone DnaK (HSP70)
MPVDHQLNPVLGIDLGTTFSAIARWDGRGPRAYQIFSPAGSTLQSVFYNDPTKKESLVGVTAYRKGFTFPENMIQGVKRLMDDATQRIVLGGQEFSPIEISAKILQYLYSDIKDKQYAGKLQSRGTVVTVPYYFKAHQCENTRQAALLADINFSDILQEPIAASLAYTWQLVQDYPDRTHAENILVFDLGGGTFDLTLFRLEQTPDNLLFEVLGTGGDDRLGGMDFDQELVKLFINKGKLNLSNLDEKSLRKAQHKLTEVAIEAKHTLSAAQIADVIFEAIPGQPTDTIVTRSELENLLQPYVNKIKGIIEKIWDDTNLNSSAVDRVILAGSSSNIPCMRALLSDIFGDQKIYANSNLSLCVAEGAAIYAAYLDDREVFGREVKIFRRTCHALGIEIIGGKFHPLIAANRKTPCEGSQIFTISNNVDALDINVYQGSSKLVKDNSLVGTINITELPEHLQGGDIKVTFKVSEEQRVSVTLESEGFKRNDGFHFS